MLNFRLLALPLVVAGVLSAQGPGPRGNSLTPPTPSEVLQRQVDFLTRFYSLTTAQVAPATTILSTEQSCLPTSAAMTAARQALVTAIKTNTKVSDAVTALNMLQGDAEGCRATAAAGIWALLDSTQQMKGIGPLLGVGGRGRGPAFRPGRPPKQ